MNRLEYYDQTDRLQDLIEARVGYGGIRWLIGDRVVAGVTVAVAAIGSTALWNTASQLVLDQAWDDQRVTVLPRTFAR